jgi:hypothetical protein
MFDTRSNNSYLISDLTLDITGQRKNAPSYRSGAYSSMLPFWCFVEDCYQGTHAVRSGSTTYLPKNEAEDQKDYAQRLARATFYNAYRRTVDGLVGTAFRKDPILTMDVPVEIRGQEEKRDANNQVTQEYKAGLAEDIDMQGTHLTVFAKKVFRNAVHQGHAFIYVDYPKEDQQTKSTESPDYTLADKAADPSRPYWVSYRADQALNWRWEYVAGHVKITQVTFREVSTEADGEFGEKQVVRYRVLRPGSWKLFRETNRKTARGDARITLEDQGETSFPDFIPLAVVYGNEVEPMVSRPTCLDLADLNVEHYQVRSDLRHTMHWSSIPILWARGRDTSKQVIAIGPNCLIDIDKDGTLQFAEHQGHAISALQAELDKIEGRMAVLGMNFLLENKPGNPITATEKVLNYADKSSNLATMMRSLVDAVEQCLEWTAKYLDSNTAYQRKAQGGSWDLQTEAANLILTPEKLQRYSDMVARAQLSNETLWDILKRGGELPANFDATVEAARTKKQREAAAKLAADMKPKPKETTTPPPPPKAGGGDGAPAGA